MFSNINSIKQAAIHVSHCVTESIVDMLSKANGMMSEKLDNQHFTSMLAFLKQYSQDVLDCVMKVSTWIDDLTEETSILVS
jgi:hypothetical protein